MLDSTALFAFQEGRVGDNCVVCAERGRNEEDGQRVERRVVLRGELAVARYLEQRVSDGIMGVRAGRTSTAIGMLPPAL